MKLAKKLLEQGIYFSNHLLTNDLPAISAGANTIDRAFFVTFSCIFFLISDRQVFVIIKLAIFYPRSRKLMPAQRVVRSLDRIAANRGYPAMLRMDNGP